MTFLVDTNVISELRKGGRADEGVAQWISAADDDALHLSVLTVGEIRCGVERIRRRDPRGARALETWLQRVVREHRDRLLPVTHEVAEVWGGLNVPDPIPVIDGLLAATALVHGLTVVTRNVADVAGTGVPVVNPFST